MRRPEGRVWNPLSLRTEKLTPFRGTLRRSFEVDPSAFMQKPLCTLLQLSPQPCLVQAEIYRSKKEGLAKRRLKFLFISCAFVPDLSLLVYALSHFSWVHMTKVYLFYWYIQIIFFFFFYLQYIVFYLVSLTHLCLFITVNFFLS